MSNDTYIRKSSTNEAGNPGEFGTHDRPDGDITLTLDTPAPTPVSEHFEFRKSGSNGEYLVDNDQTDPPYVQDGMFMTKSFTLGGEPYLNARNAAIGAMFDTEDSASAKALELSIAREKMTILTVGKNGHALIREGTGQMFREGNGILSKASRTKGYTFQGMRVVGVTPGYGGMKNLTAEYNRRAVLVPSVDKTTFDGIPEYMDNSGEAGAIAAVYLIDGPDFGSGPTPGCLFLATSIETADGSVNGYLWAPDGGNCFSESGPYDVSRLERGGRVRNYEPGSLNHSDLVTGQLGGTRESAYGVLAASGF